MSTTPSNPGAVWRRRLPSMRQAWSQLHWLAGITAGTLLVVIGLSGAILAFREELLDLFNPGVRTVPVRQAPRLAPDRLLQAVRLAHPQERVASLTLYAAPGASARAALAPAPGERRGETVHIDPYTGAMLPPLRGDAAFEWVESLHRWLLLPRESGRTVLGTLALCLLGLALSGLYLRWPRRPGHWRSWFALDMRLKGRPFLWSLHAVAGTVALPAYLVFSLTGAYWGFDLVRDTVDGWADARRPPRSAAAEPARPKGAAKKVGAQPADTQPALALAPAWSTFVARAPDWDTAIVRLPEKAGQALQVTWLAADAPHVRARGRMSVRLDGTLVKDEPYAGMGAGQRALSTIYPLHMGSYFGLPGRIAMMLASLALPGFALTGWMLYLTRRRQARAAARERALLAATESASTVPGSLPLLVAYASQSGQAERASLRTAAALRRAGRLVRVRALPELAPQDLAAYDGALFVASSFGEGEPPDAARRFSRSLQSASVELRHLRYAVLGLGDRNYTRFCGFAHALDGRLAALGARAMFPLVEVDRTDPAALARWMRALGVDEETTGEETDPSVAQAAFEDWPMTGRIHLNPGSLGAPLYEIALRPAAGAVWQAGDLLEIEPCHAAAPVDAFLAASGLRGDATVAWNGGWYPLREALARSDLPDPAHRFACEQSCADRLKAVAPRRYSLAGIGADGEATLLVRQQRHEQGLGLASGWLTIHAPLGAPVRARLAVNPSFHGPERDVPCIYIGNGSGMAGLRGHLRARVDAGRQRNWLLFGERQLAFDSLCAAEIGLWRERGALPELDLVFSRDAAGPEYVQDRLRARGDLVRAWVEDGAVVHVCGSAQGMAAGVDRALADILGNEAHERLMAAGRYRRDVY